MDLHTYLSLQKDQALSDTNRYFYWLHFGYNANSDEELMLYYAEFGARIFAQLHQGELECPERKE